MLQSNWGRYALTGIAAAALAWSAPALAQDAEPAADAEDSPVGIEEITVTAEKREASLQDTAIAVTAFTAEDLENLNMLETRDLANFTPGLTLTTFSNPTYAQAILRGIGQGDFHPLYQSRVGFYLDGVYVGNQSGISSTLLDIDRIEVLRGPQGTLYGRNTIGGAINMVTRRPSGDFGGKVQVGVGNYGLRELRGSIDFPILPERLSGRISYYNGKRDPYEDSYQAICNSPTGCGFDPLAGDWETVKGPDIWDMDRWAVTGQLSWTPNDRLTVDYTFNHFELEEGMIPEWMTDFMNEAALVGGIGLAQAYLGLLSVPEYAALGAAAAAGFVDPTTYTPDFFSALGKTRLFGSGFDAANPATYGGAFTTAGTALAFNSGFGPGDFWIGDRDDPLGCCGTQFVYDANGNLVRTQDPGADTETNFHSVTATYDVSDNLEIKTILSYREVAKSRSVSDIAFSRFPYFDAYSDSPHEQTFAELQVNGVGLEGRLEYHAGLSWFEDEFPYSSHFGSEGFAAALGQVMVLPPANEGEGEAVGYYAQLGYSLTERFKLTGGIRYSRDKKEFALPNFLLPPGTEIPGQGAPGRTGLVSQIQAASETFLAGSTSDGWTPMIRAEFDLTDDFLVYGGFSRGYQSGNFNARVSTSFDPNLVAYDPEFLEAWDAGIKSSWFDNRLRVNLAAYLYNWEEQQVQQSGVNRLTGQYEGFITNVGKSEIKGWEIELQSLPLPNLELRLAYAFNDPEVDEWVDLKPQARTLAVCQAADAPASCFENTAYYKRIHGSPARELSGSLRYSLPDMEWGRSWVMLSFFKRGRKEIGSYDMNPALCPYTLSPGSSPDAPCPSAFNRALGNVYNTEFLQTWANARAATEGYTVYSLRVQVDDFLGREGLYLAVVGENIADKDYGINSSAFSAETFGRITTQYGPPRRYRFEVGMSFGATD